MGYVNFQPEARQTYTAFRQQPGGPAVPVPFPAIQPVGVVMTVDNLSNKDNIRVFVTHNRPLPAGNIPAELTLVAQTRGVSYRWPKRHSAKSRLPCNCPGNRFPKVLRN